MPMWELWKSYSKVHVFDYSDSEISGKISGPLLDRIDIHVEVRDVKHVELTSKRAEEPSDCIRSWVVAGAFVVGSASCGKECAYCNTDTGHAELREFSSLDGGGADLLKNAMGKLGLLARPYDRTLKVARTIADLAGSDAIGPEHLAEAIQYGSLDGSYHAE